MHYTKMVEVIAKPGLTQINEERHPVPKACRKTTAPDAAEMRFPKRRESRA
jgi:hypothetical protein